LVSGLVPALLALPTLTPPAARAQPVAPALQTIALRGVDAATLRAEQDRGAPAGPALTRHPAVLTGARATHDFGLLGVTWSTSDTTASADLAISVRTRTRGAWTGWHPLEAHTDDGPDRGSADLAGAQVRAGTDPYYAGPSDGVQVRVDVLAGELPADLRLDLVDPGSSAADAALQPAQPASSAAASIGMPAVITRSQWGADESLRNGFAGYTNTVKVGFVHHTDTSNGYSASESAAMVRGVYAYHTRSLGWSDIGYNFLVDRHGQIFEGRRGGMDRPVMGAHTGGFNSKSFGVSALGNFVRAEPPAAMLHSISRVMAWKLGLHYRHPRGKAVLTSAGGGTSKYPPGAKHRFKVVSGHRNAGYTTCPGGRLYDQLPTIRSTTESLMGASLVAPSRSKGRVTATGTLRVQAGVLQRQDWRLDVVRECSEKVVRRFSGRASPARPINVSWSLDDRRGDRVRPGRYVLRLSSWNSADTARSWTSASVVRTGRRDVPTLSGDMPPKASAGFVGVPPARIGGTSSYRPLGPGDRMDLRVLGVGGVPNRGVAAVALTVTGVCPLGDGALAVYPAGAEAGNLRTVSLRRATTSRTQVVARVGVDGRVSVRNSDGETTVKVDVFGYFATGVNAPRYHPLAPVRVMDSATSGGGLEPGEARKVDVAGRRGIPADATGIVANVVATAPSESTQLFAWPTGTPRPVAAALDAARGTNSRQRVHLALGSRGRISLANAQGTTGVALDVVGYFAPASRPGGLRMTALSPRRLLDQREGIGTAEKRAGTDDFVSFVAAGRGKVPAGARAVALTVTAYRPAKTTYVTAFAKGSPLPPVSDLSAPKRLTSSNLVVVPVGRKGRVVLHNASGRTQLRADVVGYYR